MCHVIKHEIGIRPHGSCDRTVQELFAKHPDFATGRAAPTLNLASHPIQDDEWPLDRLVTIAREGQLKTDNRWRPDLAIILVLRAGDFYLIDGGHRIANWTRDRQESGKNRRVLIINGDA